MLDRYLAPGQVHPICLNIAVLCVALAFFPPCFFIAFFCVYVGTQRSSRVQLLSHPLVSFLPSEISCHTLPLLHSKVGPQLATGWWDRRLRIHTASGQLVADGRIGFEPCSITPCKGQWAGGQ